MNKKPLLLDLFCGAGGSAKGYYDAGFDIVGIDSAIQPRYPYAFIQADALAFLDTADVSQFAAIHASPPCQLFTSMNANNKVAQAKHPNLIPAIRSRLISTGLPYVIENVAGAPLLKSIMLCGMMFNLRVYRHRYFESNILLFQPFHLSHKAKAAHAGGIPKPGEFWCPVGNFGQKDAAQRAMGIHWMETTGAKSREIAQAIPPAYTKWIGQQLMEVLS